MTRLFTALSALILISCGGGGGNSVTTGSSEIAPMIRYTGTFKPDDPLAGTGKLTIEPIAGSSMIGTREIAKVELSVNQNLAQILTLPNAKGSTGQPAYAFSFAHPAISTPVLGRTCSPEVDLEMAVTDVGGYTLRKYYASCHLDVFGAFSDYGERTVKYRASGSAATSVLFYRAGHGSYVDRGIKSLGTPIEIVLKAAESDELRLLQASNQKLDDNDVVTISIEDEGGSSAISSVSRPPTGARTLLICCGAGTVVPSETHSIKFEVYTSRPGVVESPEQFSFYYKVSDPASGTIVSELSGSAEGYMSVPISVKTGYELRLEASPAREGSYTSVSIRRDSSASLNSLGETLSNRPGFPAKLKVFCCKR